MIEPSALDHASRLAGDHARSRGEDASQLKFVSGLIMAFMGCRMAMDAFDKMWDEARKPKMVGRGAMFFPTIFEQIG